MRGLICLQLPPLGPDVLLVPLPQSSSDLQGLLAERLLPPLWDTHFTYQYELKGTSSNLMYSVFRVSFSFFALWKPLCVTPCPNRFHLLIVLD